MQIVKRSEMVPISQIVSYARNARTHSKEQIAQIRASFREFGVIAPLVVDDKYNLLVGHGRLEAARAEGIEAMTCIIVEHLTEAQKRAYILADNRLALNAGWDDEMLSVELSDLQANAFDLSLLGFSDAEMNKLIYSLCDSGLPTDVKCAFLIEMAEPLIEIVNEYRNVFSKLKPGSPGTSLKDCLKALIKEYGGEIFEDELGVACFETTFLQTLVDSRVRIMHIKHSQKKMILNGKESVLYAVKMYLLYRCIAFDLLGIDQSSYQDNLHACILSWNEWNDILTAFLRKIKRKNMEG